MASISRLRRRVYSKTRGRGWVRPYKPAELSHRAYVILHDHGLLGPDNSGDKKAFIEAVKSGLIRGKARTSKKTMAELCRWAGITEEESQPRKWKFDPHTGNPL